MEREVARHSNHHNARKVSAAKICANPQAVRWRGCWLPRQVGRLLSWPLLPFAIDWKKKAPPSNHCSALIFFFNLFQGTYLSCPFCSTSFFSNTKEDIRKQFHLFSCQISGQRILLRLLCDKRFEAA